ncbi:MAG TPA: hypothetical protein VIQ30_17480, partial [Pseudonocardia sp.]
MAHDDSPENRDSAFTAITLGDLLGRSGLPYPDEHFGIVPAQRSASPYVMPRRKKVERATVPLDVVDARTDRIFVGLTEPRRRAVTTSGVALAVGSLAGATIMLGNPTVSPPDPQVSSHSDSGRNGDLQPFALQPASYPSPLSWAAGLGLPQSALSRGVLPTSSPLSESAVSGSPSPSSGSGDRARKLGELLAEQPAPAAAAPFIALPHTEPLHSDTQRSDTQHSGARHSDAPHVAALAAPHADTPHPATGTGARTADNADAGGRTGAHRKPEASDPSDAAGRTGTGDRSDPSGKTGASSNTENGSMADASRRN